MDYNPKRPMSIVLLRVYKMNNPIEVDTKPEWAGCKSWISIDFSSREVIIINQPALEDSKVL